MNYNPKLKPWPAAPGGPAGQGHIEQPDDTANIVWQSRAVEPGEYEMDLCRAMQTLFAAGADELPVIVAGLNEAGLKTPAGEQWTEASFRQEMQRLGA